MSNFEVTDPILSSPFEEPREHWWIVEGEAPERRPGRRFAHYFYRDPRSATKESAETDIGTMIELKIVTRIRERLAAWRVAGYPGASRTTLELLTYWNREGRKQPLFFAQREAAETIIFLTEARADFRQGIDVPRDEPSDDKKAEGYAGFLRYACKMATGSGKSTVMGMIAAWSILNKQADRSDARFSDVVLIVCPNVTIRDRLRELTPETGDASLYRTRDLVPNHLMPLILNGKIVVTNWHVFEPQSPQVAGDSARVLRAGVAERRIETIIIGDKTTTARGKRYLKQEDFDRQVAAGLLKVLGEERDRNENLVRVRVESVRYLESDTALIERVFGREVGGKRNILVLNDEAHHAYRIRREEPDDDEDEDDELDDFYREATVWVDGLDKVHKLRGINFCVDFSATPYYLGRVGPDANRPFPWVVSDFGLIDAIESGLVKIPQLAVRDTTGSSIPGYFNIWQWIQPQLTSSERGGRKAQPKPEAILKYAHTPIAMLAGLWEQEWRRKQADEEDQRPPVFILVCKNTQVARVLYEWIALDKPPPGIPHSKIEPFKNGEIEFTIRVDSKVVKETDTGESKSDELRWMRFTLDTVGKVVWPVDKLGRPVYPQGFVELAQKLGRPLHPPGRDVRCIVSVGMLTEGWDCNTVTHIVGLRPFMSQLLCEQVVGRGLRRTRYELNEDGRFSEETAKVFGVPFQIIPFKANPGGVAPPPAKRWHVRALSAKSLFEIQFPRVEGYTQAIRNRIAVNWESIPQIVVNPLKIPPEVQLGRLLPSSTGKISVIGPGGAEEVTLDPYRTQRRLQELKFDLAQDLVRDCLQGRRCEVPPHVLFPQILEVVYRYLHEKIKVEPPADLRDVFLAPYYSWVMERLAEAIGPDVAQGESPEMPRYESHRSAGSTAEVDFWTSREPREVVKSHLNYMVPDTKTWEQSAAYLIDTHPATQAFVKNAGLGFAIPYIHNGQTHEYVPDFIVRLASESQRFLILETKGYDELKDVKRAAAERWVRAVNADGSFGLWHYRIAEKVSEVPQRISEAATL